MRPATLFSIALATATLASPSAHAQTVWHVDDDAPPGGDGTTWTTAFDNLQSALDAAEAGHEIWVASGVYRPTKRRDRADPRSATFQLVTGVAVYGGFAGIESVREQRNPARNESTFSGDLDDDDDAIVGNPIDLRREPTRSENAYHVLTARGTDANTVLDGCRITGGAATGSIQPTGWGGGLLTRNGGLTVRNCAFVGNTAGVGGAMFNESASPRLVDCRVEGNSASSGGGVGNVFNASPTMIRCTFIRNEATRGGAIYIQESDAVVADCTFQANRARIFGGAIRVDFGQLALTGCTFTNNDAFDGGAIDYSNSRAPLSISRCVFVENQANVHGGAARLSAPSITITDCLFEANGAGQSLGGALDLTASDSAISRCTFRRNRTGEGGGGGAIATQGDTICISQCMFHDNAASRDGGALYVRWTNDARLTNCTFTGNVTERWGGAMVLDSDRVLLLNCVLSGNSADVGGGVANLGNLALVNCTVAGNSASSGGAIWSDRRSAAAADPALTVANTIVWGNRGGSSGRGGNIQIVVGAGTAVVRNSSIQHGWTGNGGGNITEDPLFVRSPDDRGDGWGIGQHDDFGDLHLRCGSPCLNAGDNDLLPADRDDLDGDGDRDEVVPEDHDGNPRITDGLVDMGAHEGPHQALVISDAPVALAEGGVGTFAVALACQPLESVDVSVRLTPGSRGMTVIPQDPLRFDSANFATPQTVTLVAAQDDDQLHDRTFIEVQIPGVSTAVVMATESDDDQPPPIILVDGAARGADSGLSWEDAYTDLEDALTVAAQFPERTVEIWVAAGVYRPSKPANTDDPRSATFTLANDVALYGGFAGGESNRRQRDLTNNETILSGDRDGDDLRAPLGLDNSYHTVTVIAGAARLDGFTIADGNALGSSHSGTRWGGGMLIDGASPTIVRCMFVGNQAGQGGAMRVRNGASPFVSNCLFRDNIVTFGSGGAVFIDFSSAEFQNCVFSGNIGRVGGAIAVYGRSDVRIAHATIIGNFASIGGAGVYTSQSVTRITNSVVWENREGASTSGGSPQIVFPQGELRPTVQYCCVQGGWLESGRGQTNIDADPAFIRAGAWWDSASPLDPTDDFWVDSDYRLDAGSPCIDAGRAQAASIDRPDLDGDGNTIELLPIDFDGNVRVQNCVVDMGAFEFGSADLPADADCDGDVDLGDYLAFGACFSGPNVPHAPGCSVFDRDGDGDVDLSDLLIVQAAFTGAQ